MGFPTKKGKIAVHIVCIPKRGHDFDKVVRATA